MKRELTSERAIELADRRGNVGDVSEEVQYLRAYAALKEHYATTRRMWSEDVETARRETAELRATIAELKVCGVVTGGERPSAANSYIGDVDVCENDRPCKEHPPFTIAVLQDQLTSAGEIIAERDATIAKFSETKLQHIATVNDLIRQRDAASKDQIEIRELLGCTEDDDDYIGALRHVMKQAKERDATIAELDARIDKLIIGVQW